MLLFFVKPVSEVMIINEAKTVFRMKVFIVFEYVMNYSVCCLKGDNPNKAKIQPQVNLLGILATGYKWRAHYCIRLQY